MYIFPAEEQNKEHNHISLSLAARVDREKQKGEQAKSLLPLIVFIPLALLLVLWARIWCPRRRQYESCRP